MSETGLVPSAACAAAAAGPSPAASARSTPPARGVAAIAVPIYYLFLPNPPIQPYTWFPWVAVGLTVAFILYSIWLVRRDPGLGDRVGSIVADE